jgi:glycosyltransferase involved in cell wall biosynthesis
LALQLVFLIRSLGTGGAERQLVKLVELLDKSVFQITVITYYHGGALASELDAVPGVKRLTIGKTGPRDLVRFFLRLVTTIRRLRPDVIHGYMPDANILAWVAGRLCGARVVWGLRASDVDFEHYRFLSGALFKVAAWLSRRADLIIANSESGRRFHAKHGYSGDRMIVIPNGIDVDRFRRDRDARIRLRRVWGVAPDAFVVGSVARLDPMKDHDTYIEAARILSRRIPNARFVIVGDGPHETKRRLADVAARAGIADSIIWLGTRTDMPAVYSAFDVAVSSSAFGEGFSNALGEAMACEVPCVTTDVGDGAAIVGDTGRVVPPRDPGRLADGLAELAADDRVRLGDEARSRIQRLYSVDALARDTAEALVRVSPRAL